MNDTHKPLYSLSVNEFVQLLNKTVAEALIQIPKETKNSDDTGVTVNIKELAEMFHCSEVTIFNHRKKGWLPRPYQMGRKLVWDKAEILEFLKTPVNRRKVKI